MVLYRSPEQQICILTIEVSPKLTASRYFFIHVMFKSDVMVLINGVAMPYMASSASAL